MPLPTKMGFVEGKGLDFFVDTYKVIYQMREHVENQCFGVGPFSILAHAILHRVEYLRDMPLRTLNDKLKRYPFVDPLGFDMLLSQMLSEPLQWLKLVTNPAWFTDAIHKAGETSEPRRGYGQRLGMQNVDYDMDRERRNSQASQQTSTVTTEDDMEEEEDYNAFGSDMKEFTYPYPIKLRELQGMVRPFMEVKSSHHIAGLDAIISETVRGFLALFQHVEAWDRALMTLLEKLAADPEKAMVMAGQIPMESSRMKIVSELAAMIQMDSYELTHRLFQVESSKFHIDEVEIEMVGNKYPFFQEQAVLRGLPQAQYYGSRGSHESRVEALAWWRDNSFSHATPTRILATSILGELLDAGLHPDPHVAEAFPRVLSAIFGEQILQVIFMDYFTPLLGGFVDGQGFNVPPAEGFRPKSNPSRTAEAVLVFLRSWVDAVTQFENEAEAKKKHAEIARQNGTDPSIPSGWRVPDVKGADIVGLLEGEIDVPDELTTIPCEKQRYAISDNQKRIWELESRRLHFYVEHLHFRDRDLGPYLHVDPENPESLKAAWGLQSPGNREQSSLPFQPKQPELRHEISDAFGLKLVEWPADASDSTFVRFFAPSEDGAHGKHIARGDLDGLPPLPWSFGSDQRNTVIVDVPDEKLANFQCLFVASHLQPNVPCVVPLGDPFVAPMYILTPKYQHLPVKNGYRLICHSWVFECRIMTTGLHASSLSLLTDEGEIFEVPSSGCHVGAGHRSKQLEHQPRFPQTKMALKHRLQGMSTVHIAFHYNKLADRWTLVDHSPGPFDTLLQLKPGHGYPLTSGLRVRLGEVTLEAVIYR